jgi:hypothetical protein
MTEQIRGCYNCKFRHNFKCIGSAKKNEVIDLAGILTDLNRKVCDKSLSYRIEEGEDTDWDSIDKFIGEDCTKYKKIMGFMFR